MPLYRGVYNADLDQVNWREQTMGVVTPSDFLTMEEQEALSGPVRTYYLTKEEIKVSVPVPEGIGAPKHQALTRENLAAAVAAGKTAREMAEMFGVSESVIYERKRRFGLAESARTSTPAAAGPGTSGPKRREDEYCKLVFVKHRLAPKSAAALVNSVAQYLETGVIERDVAVRVVVEEIPQEVAAT